MILTAADDNSQMTMHGLLGLDTPHEALEVYGWPLVGMIVACGVVLLSLHYYSYRSDDPSKQHRHRKRKLDRQWSFTSRAMGLGSFPPSIEFHEPIINSVLVFETSNLPTVSQTLEVVEQLCTKYDRFGQVYDPTTNTTIKTTHNRDFDVQDLIRVIEFDSSKLAGGDASSNNSDRILMKLMEDHALDPLSYGPRRTLLPWWEFLMLKDTSTQKPSQSKSAIVWRVHHAIGDGISLVNVVQDLFTDSHGKPLPDLLPRNMDKKFSTKHHQQQRSRTWSVVVDLLSSIGTALGVPTSPFDTNTYFYSRSKAAKVSPSKVLKYPNQFGIYTFEPVPLDFIQQLKDKSMSWVVTTSGNITVNDILFTVTSQAIFDYLQANDDPALLAAIAASQSQQSQSQQQTGSSSFQCRALLPVAIPRPLDTHPLRNLWCFVSVDMAVVVNKTTTNAILNRLSCIHTTMQTIKHSFVPAVMMGLQNYVLPILPYWFNRDQVVQIFSRHSFVASNVPGPSMKCCFAHCPVEHVHMVHCNLIPQLSFLSYNGMMFGNFTMGVVEEVERNSDNDDDVIQHGQRDRDEKLPIFISRAWVQLAKALEFDEKDIPKTIRDHALKKI